MKLKSPQAKGKRWEYYIRDLLIGYGYQARRTPLSGAIDGWEGDITSPDFPFFIECKNTAKTLFPQWWKKANDETQTKPPIIIWNHKGEAFGFMLLTDLLSYMTKESPRKKFDKPKLKQKVDITQDLPFSKTKQSKRIPCNTPLQRVARVADLT